MGLEKYFLQGVFILNKIQKRVGRHNKTIIKKLKNPNSDLLTTELEKEGRVQNKIENYINNKYIRYKT